MAAFVALGGHAKAWAAKALKLLSARLRHTADLLSTLAAPPTPATAPTFTAAPRSSGPVPPTIGASGRHTDRRRTDRHRRH